jgi:RES domain-containing protein
VIFASVGPNDVFYRLITPKWSHQPASGAGAALHGGRFNRPGVEALYLAQDIDTAVAEYRQGSTLPPPAMLVTYQVTFASVIDFSKGYDAYDWAAEWQDWCANWRSVARIDNLVPQSWVLADRVLASGAAGLLYPSLRRPTGTNLVVLPRLLRSGDRIGVHDPDGRLPRDQTSWV